jgi:hypothetical protein
VEVIGPEDAIAFLQTEEAAAAAARGGGGAAGAEDGDSADESMDDGA